MQKIEGGRGNWELGFNSMLYYIYYYLLYLFFSLIRPIQVSQSRGNWREVGFQKEPSRNGPSLSLGRNLRNAAHLIACLKVIATIQTAVRISAHRREGT